MQAHTSRPGHPALREGLVFGVILGIIHMAGNLLQNFVVSRMLGNILAVLLLMIFIVLTGLAGVRASQQTGRVGTGALAGLIVELIDSLFGVLLILTKIFVFNTLLHQMFTHATVESTLVFIMVSSLSFLVYLLMGAVFGTIGGLIGRKHAQLPLHV